MNRTQSIRACSDVSSVQTSTPHLAAEDGPLDVEAVSAHKRAQRVLCICNTVERAQALYRALRREYGPENCRLLHSRFYRDDRRTVEDFVQERFKDRGTRQTILVATQVVEVGLDISSNVLLTECAPCRESRSSGLGAALAAKEKKGVCTYSNPMTVKGR
jgi:CRISPR/Cas system-associated endonuclease/helicase Cas3